MKGLTTAVLSLGSESRVSSFQIICLSVQYCTYISQYQKGTCAVFSDSGQMFVTFHPSFARKTAGAPHTPRITRNSEHFEFLKRQKGQLQELRKWQSSDARDAFTHLIDPLLPSLIFIHSFYQSYKHFRLVNKTSGRVLYLQYLQ